MIIFLYGKDSYRLKQNIQKIIDEYRKKNSGMSFMVFDFSEESNKKINDFRDAIKTVSFFDEKKLIQLNGALVAGEEIVKVVKEYNLTEDKQTILIFAENAAEAELAKKSKKLFTFLSAKPNVVKSFEPLAGKQLENWILNETEGIGTKIEPAAARKLVEYAGNDSWRLAVEIEKLANYAAAGNSLKITEDNVKLLVAPKINLNIFETVDAIAGKNRGRAVVLLNNHLTNGEDPYYLFLMVIYQFRNLLRVKSLTANPAAAVSSETVAKKTGLHPFAAKKMLEQSQKYELEELKNKFIRLADSDIAIKNGRVDIVDCLYQIVLL